MKYRKKPVTIEATQWFKPGDHPKVVEIPAERFPAWMPTHGWIETLKGGHIVAPGDWIITGVAGEHYPCKPDIFAQTYEAADALESCAMPMDHEDTIYAAYKGILVLGTLCRKAGLTLGEQRSKDLLVELGAAFPHLAARAALRSGTLPAPPKE